MRPAEFGENLAPGTKVILFSDDKPDRIVTIVERLADKILPKSDGEDSVWVQFLVEDEELRRHLLLNEPEEEEWWLWRHDHQKLDGKSIFAGALIED